MGRTPKEVPDAELAVLEVLWRCEEATVRELAGALYPTVGASEIATVQKLCERLLAKRCVTRDRTVRPATFRAAVDRGDLIGRHLQGVADKLCSGSVAPLLTHLVESAELDADAIQKLREQVERLDRERGGDEGGGDEGGGNEGGGNEGGGNEGGGNEGGGNEGSGGRR